MSKESNIEVKIYTILDLKDWIYRGIDNGLSTSLISNARALAIVNNPYAKDSYPALTVAFDDNSRPVGYMAVMADRWNEKTVFFATTGYTNPKLRGKGIGTMIYSVTKEACNNMWFVSDASSGTIAINKKLGLAIHYYERYYLKYIHSSSFSSILRAKLVHNTNKRVLKSIQTKTRLKVLRYIDEQTYSFIARHEKNALFHRSREMLNWILQYPFKACAPADMAAYSDYEFTAALPQYSIYAFRIMLEDVLIGFAMFRLDMGELTMLYLYADDKYETDVYAAIVKHVLSQDLQCFRSMDKGLIEYYNKLGAQSMNSKSRIQPVPLCVPANIEINPSFRIQGGDGDMFC